MYQRIDRRVDNMLADGLVEEVQKLKDMGCSRSMVSMQGLGYKEILDYLDGTISLERSCLYFKTGYPPLCQASADLVSERTGCEMAEPSRF